MNKRLLSCLLLAVFCLSFMPAHAENAKVELLVWEVYGPDIGIPAWGEQFNEAQDAIQVTSESFASAAELMEKLQSTSDAGEGLPNIILTDMLSMPAIGALTGLIDLMPYLEATPEIWDDLYLSLLEYSFIDEQLLSLHAYANAPVLYYNRALLEAADLNPDAPPQTWEELVEYAKATTSDGVWGFYTGAFGSEEFEDITRDFETYVWQAGGEMWEPEFEAAFNSEQGRSALQFMVDLVVEHKVAPLEYPENGFEDGKVAMIMADTAMNETYEAALAENLMAVPLPFTEFAATNVGGEQWMILPSDEAKQDASWEYLKYMLSAEVFTSVCEAANKIPSRMSVAEGEAFRAFADAHPGIRATMDSLPFGRMRAAMPAYSQASAAIAPIIRQAIAGDLEVQEAMDQAEAAWNGVIAE